MVVDRAAARDAIQMHLDRVRHALEALPVERIVDVVDLIEAKCAAGRTIYIAGNGGSASTASHMACDLGNNVLRARERKTTHRFRVIALVDAAATVTAIANDDGYEWVFARQLRVLAEPGDLLILMSASGNSPNVIEAAKAARDIGVSTVGFVGFGGGLLKELVDLAIVVTGYEYGPVEDVHLVLNHAVANTLQAILSR